MQRDVRSGGLSPDSNLNASMNSALNTSVNSLLDTSTNSLLLGSSGTFFSKPMLSSGRIARARDGCNLSRLESGRSQVLDSSLSLRNVRSRRGVQICEDANEVLEISTRSVRVARGDLDLFYPEDFEQDPVIECFMCRDEAESDAEAGAFRIYNLPDGGWQILCPRCDPPDPAWEFDRTVAVVDSLLPPDLMQLVYLFLTSTDTTTCAKVCRQWNELSWTVLTLRDDGAFLRRLANAEKLRNVWVLRVFLHQSPQAETRLKQLCDRLHPVDALSELTVTGVSGDNTIARLAHALRNHPVLQVLDLGACAFGHEGLQAILSAMEENKSGMLELILPKCCMNSPGHRYSSIEAAQYALDSLLAGSSVTGTLV